MGKDKRKELECIVYAHGQSAIIQYDADTKKPALYNSLYDNKVTVCTVNIPSSVEEILITLDVRNIKWKSIRFIDKRVYRGVLDHKKIYEGSDIILTREIMNDLALRDEILEKINKIILAKRCNSIAPFYVSPTFKKPSKIKIINPHIKVTYI